MLLPAAFLSVSFKQIMRSASLQSTNKSLDCDLVMQVRAMVGETEMRPHLICGKSTALKSI